MKNLLLGIKASLFFQFGVLATLAQTPTPPSLSIRAIDGQSIQIAWPNTGTPLVLEENNLLGNPTLWQPVTQVPVLANNQYSISFRPAGGSRFFRLNTPSLTTIRESSPVDGETGVAVMRETIVYFSGPLAADAVVTPDHFYATFAGRRLLSRVELSSDRRKATLFYLERLPGSARVTVLFDGAGLTDAFGRPLDPAGTETPYGLKVIHFDTLNLTPLAGTAVIGRVFASELMPGADTGTNAVNRPLEGVTITVDGREQELRTTTDALGNFTLTPVPPGRFFVKIDGRTAKGSVYPSGAYYPYVGKAWDAVAGRTNNLAGGTGDIFLPLITVGTLQPVSLTQDTPVSFPADVIASNPALAGVSITVPANSLFSDDGTRGGKVGIAPVPPDRLPGPLPPGLQPPIVITVQTDGPLNFDRPAPVCFPNLMDPVLGTLLLAGSQQELISFNHKKGIWEGVGSMTVSADGKFICTDPGVGILQPGWHGVAPKPDGPPPPEDPCGGGPKPALASYSPDPIRRADPREIGLHKNTCLSCKPDEHSFQLCLEVCKLLSSLCHDKNNRDHRKNKKICDKKGKDLGTFAEVACSNEENDRFGKQDVECTEKLGRCEKACRRCWTSDSDSLLSTSRSPIDAQAFQASVLGPESESLRELILNLLDQARAILAPYVEKGNAPTPEARAQADALYEHADRLGGGDAATFLEIHAIELERQISQLESQVGPPTEGPPSYPVRYVADILRPNGLLYLRGETAPLGQYSVFVPRDGSLLSVSFYDPHTQGFDQVQRNSRPEAPYALDAFSLRLLPTDAIDSDHDGLPDFVEAVYGTDRLKADTDGDGIPDGAEVENGANPLDGLPAQTGILATAKTPGSAVDICAANDLAIVAELDKGVSIFNIFNGMNPTLIAQVPTPGNAQRISAAGNFIAVAAGDAGLAIIDASDAATARIVHQLQFASGAQAVAAGGGMAYVGLNSGTIAAVDLASGLFLRQLYVTNAVRDLALAGDYLYALTDNRLYAVGISSVDGTLSLTGSTDSPITAAPAKRLFAGGGLAYAVHRQGYNPFDLADPAHPVLIKAGTTTQFGWRQMAANSSGLGLAAVGPNSFDSEPDDVSLYDLSSATNTDVAITTFPTPGLAQAVAIYKGLAYVADGEAGLQVINYLAYDSKGVVPKVTLSASFPLVSAQIQEGTRIGITANATDDVQVREVEFYLDGNKVETDGSFPFEFRLRAPSIVAGQDSFKVRAKATDTGGNFTWSEEVTVKLLPDTVPPRVTYISPRTVTAGINSVSVAFDEEIAPASFTASALRLFTAGPDGVMGTADDVELLGGSRSLQSGRTGATLGFSTNLPLGKYRIVIGRDFADRRGNHLAADVISDFRVVDAVYWVRPEGGDWSNPQNWSTGRLPGPADDVIIAPSLGGNITHSRGNDSIKSLVSDNPFLLTGGRLEIAETIQVNELFQISDAAVLARARVLVGVGPAALFAFQVGTLDEVTLDGALIVPDGASMRILHGLTVNGLLTLASKGSLTQLLFDGPANLGDQTLGGTGQVLFGPAGGRNAITALAPLTIGSGLTIRGSNGSIGGSVTNQGTITADVAGQTLTFTGEVFRNEGTLEVKNGAELRMGGSWMNTGTVRVSDGTLNLNGTFITAAGIGKWERTGGTVNIIGTLDNTGATLALDGSTGPWVLVPSGTIRGGNVTASGGATLQIAPVGSSYATLDGLTLDTDVMLENNAFINVINGLTVNATLTIAALTGAGAGLDFLGTQTLGGKGQVVFGGTGANRLRPQSGTLTIGPALTIRGGNGPIGGSSIINRGTIVADVAGQALTLAGDAFTNQGTLEVKNGAELTLGGSWTNTGVLRLNEGTLNLGGTFTTAGIGKFERTSGKVNIIGVLDNAGATLALNAGTGSWVLVAGGTIRGGNVTTSGGAALQIAPVVNTFATLDGLTLDTDVTLENVTYVNVVNGLTVNGTFTIVAPNGAGLDFLGTQTLGGKGQVVIGGIESNRLRPQSGTLTIGPELTIRVGSGRIGGSSLGASSIINQGTIVADVAGQALTFFGDAFTNQGTVEVKNGAALTLGGSWANTGVLRLNEGTLNLGGTFTTSGLGRFERIGGNVNITGTLDNTGATLALNAGTGSWILQGTLRGGNIITADGATLVPGFLPGYGAGILDGVTLDGDMTLADPLPFNVVNGLTLNGALTVTSSLNQRAGLAFNGTQTLGGKGQVVFAGTGGNNVLLPTSGTLTIGPALTIRGGSGAIGDQSLPLVNEGTISADVAGGVITIRGNPFTGNGKTLELNGGRIVVNP